MMVDEIIDPRTVEAMKIFRMESENANEVFKKLERHMHRFTRNMNMANVKTVDFAKNWKDVGKNMKVELPNMGEANSQGFKSPSQTKEASAKNERRENKVLTSKVEIGTIRIDVGGVTDKTDKQKLADDISKKVAKSLQSSMGGPLSNRGYNRGM